MNKILLLWLMLGSAAFAENAGLQPFSATFASTGGLDSVSFRWEGGGGVNYALKQCPDLFFTNRVTSRYYLGDGGGLSAGSELPADRSGFWKVVSCGTSNGICVAQAGEYAGKLVRYDDDGTPRLLHAFGVNYYDAFLRYLNDESDTSFVEGFEYLRDHSIPVARVLAAGFWPTNWSLYFSDAEAYFQRLDFFFAEAERCGVGLIVDCFWSASTIGELVDDAVEAGCLVPGVDFVPVDPLNTNVYGEATCAEYKTALGRPDSGSIALIRRYTRELVERYAASPAVWGWEFGNEYNNEVDYPNITVMRDRPGGPAQGMMLAETTNDKAVLPAWTGRDDLIRADVLVAKQVFADTVRSTDTWRLIMSGDTQPRTSAYHNWTVHSWTKDTRAEMAQVLPVDNPSLMDTVTVHIYPKGPDAGADIYFTDAPVTNEWLTGQYKELLDCYVEDSAAMGRPLIVGEWGVKGDGTTAGEQATFHRMMQALIDSNVQLSLLWDFDNQNAGQTEEWWVNPGTDKEYQLTNEDPEVWDLEQANLYFSEGNN